MSRNRKELKKLISEMSLEEKALQLTQFPSYELDDNQDVFRVKKLSFQTFSIKERVKRAKDILLDAQNR